MKFIILISIFTLILSSGCSSSINGINVFDKQADYDRQVTAAERSFNKLDKDLK